MTTLNNDAAITSSGVTSTPAPQPAATPVPGGAAPQAPDAPPVELVIRPRTGWIGIDWDELWRYRELLYFLVWRDIKVRYKQTILGFAWAVLQPLINAVIYTIVFGAAAGFKRFLPDGVPYLIFAFVGQLPWQFYAVGMNTGGMSLVSQQHLLTKIYFPRLFLPLSAVGGALFDLLVSLLVLGGFMVWFHFTDYRFAPAGTIVLLPLLLVPTVVAAVGVAFTLSALTVTYRDFRFLIPFAVQILMLLSFVMFPREAIVTPGSAFERFEWVLGLNPMYGIIQAYRHLALGMAWNPWVFAESCAVAAALLVFGLFYFRKTERRFADIA